LGLSKIIDFPTTDIAGLAGFRLKRVLSQYPPSISSINV
jgi:hypothetical protein